MFRFIFLFLFLMGGNVVIGVDRFCNRTGYSGPRCSYLDCGNNGLLNFEGSKCICDQGYKGTRCSECSESIEDRTFVCCSIGGISDGVSNWMLVASKEKDLSKFLSGIYTAKPCLMPSSKTTINSTEYNINCNCKFNEISSQKRSIENDNNNNNEINVVFNNKRGLVENAYDFEVFWKMQISKRTLKIQNEMITASNLADILTDEIYLLGNMDDSTKVKGHVESCPTQPFSEGGKLLLFWLIFGLVIVIFIFILLLYCACRYKKQIKGLSDITKSEKGMKAKMNTLEFLVKERKGINSILKHNKLAKKQKFESLFQK